jgi:hypothetical protein
MTLRSAVFIIVLLLLLSATLYGLAAPAYAWGAPAVLSIPAIFLLLCTTRKPWEQPTYSTLMLPCMADREFELHQAKMRYAWDWFSYHADQRLKAFNFFIVIIGILIVTYGTAMKESISNDALATNATTSTQRSFASMTPSTVAAPSQTTSATSTTSTVPSELSVAKAANSAKSYSRFACVVALCGAVIAIAFWMVEFRNAELVECGRRWLVILEGQMGMSIRQEDEARQHLRKALWDEARLSNGPWLRTWVFTHRFWMRTIYFLSLVGFLVAAGFALEDFKTTNGSRVSASPDSEQHEPR